MRSLACLVALFVAVVASSMSGCLPDDSDPNFPIVPIGGPPQSMPLQLGARCRGVTAARRVDWSGVGVETHQSLNDIRLGKVVSFYDQALKGISDRLLLIGAQSARHLRPASELNYQSDGRNDGKEAISA